MASLRAALPRKNSTRWRNRPELDYVIIDPTLTSAVNSVNNPRYANALVQAFNLWYLDTFVDYDGRLKGTILAFGHKPTRMAEEIDEHTDEDGIVGVQLPASALVPPAGDEKYDPIYQAAENNGLPIVMHSVSNTTGFAFPIQSTWNQAYVEDHMIHHPFTHMWNLKMMMFRGLPERFPDLEYVLQESGIAWLPYATWRMDDHYLELSHEIPWLDKLPSEYVDEKWNFSTQPLDHTDRNPQHLAQIIEIAVFRVNGEFYAVLNYCVHQAGPLWEGQVTSDVTVAEDGWTWEYDKKDRIISCPWHGWKFDIASDINIDDDQYAVPTYLVEVKDDSVYVVVS